MRVFVSDKGADALLVAGLFFLALSSAAQFVFSRHALLPPSRADAFSGLLAGFAIGLLIVSLYRRRVATRRLQ